MESLKFKSIRSKPRQVIKDDFKIPSRIYINNSNIELCIDAVYINGVVFMVFIKRQMKYIPIIHIIYHKEEAFSRVLIKYFKSILHQDSISLSFIHIINSNHK